MCQWPLGTFWLARFFPIFFAITLAVVVSLNQCFSSNLEHCFTIQYNITFEFVYINHNLRVIRYNKYFQVSHTLKRDLERRNSLLSIFLKT